MPSQVILWSQARTACHLLERMLSNQPRLQSLFHPMSPARRLQAQLMLESSVEAGIPDDTRKPYIDAVNAGVATWEKAWEETQAEGKLLFVHEHAQFATSIDSALEYVRHAWNSDAPSKPINFTMIPDNLLLKPGTAVILTTRHPAWVIPAVCRAMGYIEGDANRSNLIFVCNMHWQRALYDWYTQNGVKAVVVEAEDYMTSPDLVRKLCSEVGLDPERALFSWPRATEEEKAGMRPVVVHLLHSLLNSTGLIPGKANPPPILADEEVKWKQEFGEERARLIKELVDAAMPDYEYLRARKLTL